MPGRSMCARASAPSSEGLASASIRCAWWARRFRWPLSRVGCRPPDSTHQGAPSVANRRAPRTPPGATLTAPDTAAMATAVRDFLRAAGLPLSDANLVDTPERVAEAWVSEFLDGYASTPEEALGESFP